MQPGQLATLFLAVVVSLTSSGCPRKPPHVLLRVEDPAGIATGNAMDVLVGLSRERMFSVERHKGDGLFEFPLTVAVEGGATGAHTIWVEALDSDALLVARGSVTALFRRENVGVTVVAMRRICESDEDCVDPNACDGIDLCDGGLCIPSPPPCDDGNDIPWDGCDECRLAEWEAQVIAGEGPAQGDPLSTILFAATAVAVDRAGDILLADPVGAHIWRLDAATGRMMVRAGSGLLGTAGPGPATGQGLGLPAAIAVDGGGTLYVAERESGRILTVDPAGTVDVLAGSLGQHPDPAASPTDGVGAASARLDMPSGLAFDGQGNLYVTEASAGRIRRIDANPGHLIETVVHGVAELLEPSCIVADAAGNLYVCSSGNGRVYRHDAISKALTLVAGGGTNRVEVGAVAAAEEADIGVPRAVALHGDEVLYIADATDYYQVFRVDLQAGTLHIVAGNGEAGAPALAGPATDSPLWASDLAVDLDGRLLIVDGVSGLLLRLRSDGTLETVAGGGVWNHGLAARLSLLSSGGLATLVMPGDTRPPEQSRMLAVASAEGHFVYMVGELGQTAVIVAGTGQPGFSSADEGGPAHEAVLSTPRACAADASGNLYVAEEGNGRVRQLRPTYWDPADPDLHRAYTIHGFVGCDAADPACVCVPDGAVTCDPGQVPLTRPGGVAVDPDSGTVYIADTGAHRILKVAGGQVAHATGTGEPGFSGEGEAAGAPFAQVNEPRGLVFLPGFISNVTVDSPMGPLGVVIDATDVVLFADRGNHRVRAYAEQAMVDYGAGLMDVAPVVITLVGEDGAVTSEVPLRDPRSLYLEEPDNLLIVDHVEHLRVFTADESTGNTLTTLHGGAAASVDGPALTARFAAPEAVVSLDTAGNDLIIADRGLGTLRRLSLGADATVTTVAGYPLGHTLDGGEAATARRLDAPSGLAFDSLTGFLYVSEAAAHRVMRIDTNTTPWTLHRFISDGEVHYPGAPDPVPSFDLNGPAGLIVRSCTGGQDPCGACTPELYIADSESHVVRALSLGGPSADGRVVAGTEGRQGSFADGGDATAVLLSKPYALAQGADGALYVANIGTHLVARVTCDGLIDRVIGTGTRGATGSGAPANAVSIDSPGGLALDAHGNLLVTSVGALQLVATHPTEGWVSGDSSVVSILGSTSSDYPEAVTRCPSSVLARPDGTVVVLDRCTGLVVELQLR